MSDLTTPSTSSNRGSASAIGALIGLLLFAFGALGACFSSPTPHPGVEGEANGTRGDVTDPPTGAGDPDTTQDNVPEGPPCAPGDVVGGDAFAAGDVATPADTVFGADALYGDAAGPDCGVTDPEPDGVSAPAAGR